MVLSTLVLIGSNVLLQSPWGRGWMEKRLGRVTGLSWEVRSLSWTPWCGLQLTDVEARFRGASEAEAIYQVESINVRLYWMKLLDGEPTLKQVTMKKGRVAVPLEFTSLLPRRPKKQQANKESTAEARPEVVPPLVVPPLVVPIPVPSPPDEKPPPEPTISEQQPPPPNRIPAGLPATIRLEDFSVSLYSLSGKGRRRIEVSGIDAELPVGGEDTDGMLRTLSATMGGEKIANETAVEVHWRRPYIAMPITQFYWGGVTVEATGYLKMRGAPVCSVEVRVKPEPLEAAPVAGWKGMELEAGQASMSARFLGNLNELSSWRGQARFDLSDMSLYHKKRGELLPFDMGRLIVSMRGGAIRVADARLQSERLSFLGNGLATADGRVLGVMRVVADREYAESITRIAVGSFLTGGWTRSWLVPLETPDRHFRDINVRGTLAKCTVDVGRKGEELEVGQAWDRMLAFVKNEEEETELGIPPSPPRERILTPQ